MVVVRDMVIVLKSLVVRVVILNSRVSGRRVLVAFIKRTDNFGYGCLEMDLLKIHTQISFRFQRNHIIHMIVLNNVKRWNPRGRKNIDR